MSKITAWNATHSGKKIQFAWSGLFIINVVLWGTYTL